MSNNNDEPSDEAIDTFLGALPAYQHDDEDGKVFARRLVRFILKLSYEGRSRGYVQELMKEAWIQAQLESGGEPSRWVIKDGDGKLH